MPGSVPPGYNAVIMKNAAGRPVAPMSPAAKRFAAQAARNVSDVQLKNKLVSRSPGGRVQPHLPAPPHAAPVNHSTAAASTAPGSAVTSTPAAPVNPNLSPEDAALQGNYNDSQLNFMDSTKLQGMAGKIQLPNAMQYANSMANLQYGDKINQIAGRIKGLTAALPGSLQALDKAFANLDAQRVATVVNPQTSGQGVANLFGGNAGAAGVAANQSAQASATAANQAGSMNDEAAASQRQHDDWATRIQLLNNMAVNQGRTDLAGAVGDRGNAEKAYYDQGLKMRGDMVSQAISNQGALNNQKIARALASGQLEGLNLTNAQKSLLNKQLGIDVAAEPGLKGNAINQGKQNILTTITARQISGATAKAQLKQLAANAPGGVRDLSQALNKGGSQALQAMILPQTAISADSSTGKYTFNGDPNSYFNSGVDNIMKSLPGSDRGKVRQYVANQINVALQGAGRPWVYKGTPNGKGRFVKAKTPAKK